MKEYKEYLDEIVGTAKKAAGVIADKASEAAETAKLETKLYKESAALNREYTALGQIVFQMKKGLLKYEDKNIETACERIQTKIDAVAALQAEKEKIKEAHRKDASESQAADEKTEAKKEEKKQEAKEDGEQGTEEDGRQQAEEDGRQQAGADGQQEAKGKENEEDKRDAAQQRDENGYFVLKFCPKCKVGNPPDAKRCVNCGAPFPDAGETE